MPGDAPQPARLAEMQSGAEAVGLLCMGIAPDGDGSVSLIGTGPDFWPVFTDSAEYRDGAPDPLDRWSKRIGSRLAADAGGTAVYPSDGPPYPPFLAWAQATGRFWQSPVGMLVHDTAGLMISLRFAVCLPDIPAPPRPTAPSPCTACPDQPCRTACPVDALATRAGYDVAACRDHIRTPDGADCMSDGCRARRICPVSQSFGRPAAQSAFHMRAFV